jgi:hypothetical protein
MFNYRLPRLVFQADETPSTSAFFWSTLYQQRRLVQPFLNWQNENWTQIRNLQNTQNIYKLRKDTPTYWNETRHLLHYTRAMKCNTEIGGRANVWRHFRPIHGLCNLCAPCRIHGCANAQQHQALTSQFALGTSWTCGNFSKINILMWKTY